MTTIIAQFDDPTKLEKTIAFFNRLKIPFQNIEKDTAPLDDPESEETLWVRNQLTEKYVKTGAWDTMDDDDRQDAALGEMMLFSQAQPDYHVFTAAESKAYRTQLRQKLMSDAKH